mmetsp:Transcript_12414/g.26817  ORF Transcript_12414/g.26817 Transcript_12414/m.26817 type:complete len:94 (+) Transcript_12414:160-441(+)
MPSSNEVKSLFRAFLREGRKFPNYNIREYVLRRAREGFREVAGETNATKLDALWASAKEQLEVVKRQSVVYGLYGRKTKNILELDQQFKTKPA